MDASIDLSNIFMLIKWPAQNSGRVFGQRVLQNDVLHIVEEGLADDSWRTPQELLTLEHKPIRIVVPYERGTRVFMESKNAQSYELEQ